MTPPPVYRPANGVVSGKKPSVPAVFPLQSTKVAADRSRSVNEARSFPAPQRAIQRVAINLQTGDSIIDKIQNYMTDRLGITDEVLTAFPTVKRKLLEHENIYLYGHGSTSESKKTSNDLFAKLTVNEIAQRVADSCEFPENYSGSVYLIGCKTFSMVSMLKEALQSKCSRTIPVLGTPELMTTDPNGSVGLRHSPTNDEDSMFRQQLDTYRGVLQKTVFDVYTAWQRAVEAFQAMPRVLQEAPEQKIRSAIELGTAAREKHKLYQLITKQKAKELKGETDPILVGKRTAYERVAQLLELALDEDFDEDFGEFCKLEKWDAEKIDEIEGYMKEAAKQMNEWKGFFVRMITSYDSEHASEQSPFSLGLMVN